jgi:hypothetical protein
MAPLCRLTASMWPCCCERCWRLFAPPDSLHGSTAATIRSWAYPYATASARRPSWAPDTPRRSWSRTKEVFAQYREGSEAASTPLRDEGVVWQGGCYHEADICLTQRSAQVPIAPACSTFANDELVFLRRQSLDDVECLQDRPSVRLRELSVVFWVRWGVCAGR